MVDQYEGFIKVLKALEDEAVEYVLIGGYAVVLHGFLRATQDIDLFINPTDGNVSRLRNALNKVYADKEIEEITLAELTSYPVIRYGTRDGLTIDLIARIGDAFQFSDLRHEVKMIEGVNIRVATPETLYALKKNTLREIDQLDLRFLERKMRDNAG